ncbi:MAG: hydrogenase maturation nickel metallochaperone HypA [Acidobacteriota bacterium]
MHELSIAMGIVDGAAETARDYPGQRVEIVHLILGELSGVVKEALMFSYELACAHTPLEGSRLQIEEVKAAIHCDECGVDEEVRSIQDMRCSICSRPSPNVVRGRELMIESLELSDEYAAAVS